MDNWIYNCNICNLKNDIDYESNKWVSHAIKTAHDIFSKKQIV
jgi:hypothetical protein